MASLSSRLLLSARSLPSPAAAEAASWLRRLLPASALSLWDGLLLAAPKKRTSHAKKRMRMANKYLRPDPSLKQCDMCGAWKRPHVYCSFKCPGRRH